MSLPKPVSPSLHLDSRDDRGLGGLVASAGAESRALPLARVKVRAEIAGGVCRAVIEQVFLNTLSDPMEAVHIFPLPEDGAVTEVELRCGELVVRAECKEKQEAQAVFDRAKADGHRAALLTQERDDVHTLRVTNLPPGESVTVRIVVVENLEIVDGRFRWRFPTTIPPRFLPGDPTGHGGAGVLPDTDQVPDASRLQPPLRLEGGTALDLEVSIAGPIANLESSLHALKLDFDGGLRLAPSGAATLNKDFALAFATGAPERTAARAWTDGAHTLVVVDPPTVALPASLPRDAVFVVDISGSMGGQKMSAARQAIKSALHGLLPGDRFMLIAFDDRLEFFHREFTAYDDRSLARADRWISQLSARGGTQMLPAIQSALEGETPEGRLRTVLFITDGQAWNEDELMAAVANRRKRALFFTLGIDTAVNGALLKRLARVGGGTCELAAPSDDIEAVIASLEARFGSPVADQVTVDGHIAGRLGGATLFTGRPATLLIEGAPSQLTVRGVSAEGAFALTAEPQRVDFPLGALWARRRVAALQDRLTCKPFEEEALRPEILRVALEFQIASRYTSFVAVERSRVLGGEPVEVVQPAELPEGWDASFKTGGMGGAGLSAPGGAPAPRRMRSMSAGKKRKAERRPSPMSFAEALPAEAYPVGEPMDAMEATSEMAPSPASPAPPARSLASKLFGSVFESRDKERQAAPPPPAPSPRQDAGGAGRQQSADPAGELARTQGADGGFGGDIARTAAALLTLVLLGHTRRKGLRRRTVTKAAAWLSARAEDPRAALAIAALIAAERGQAPAPDGDWRALAGAGVEGGYLSALI